VEEDLLGEDFDGMRTLVDAASRIAGSATSPRTEVQGETNARSGNWSGQTESHIGDDFRFFVQGKMIPY
jgi:hypothetical protein